ncbi:TRAP transporter small permease [Metabacillus sediminilitoris]|uniref:TRAP transporter small permease n=1 Tax=Metabacillus sediminilitoris TaxID=2567941 RepID=A0A4S4BQ10_9BACI|nr:TRAP transporter small permease [Metabacillus sediminilitoris]QGQ45131.1 TRAP transporter small permease subunit [Metabacillus sediminilitoris]THF76497.1 TRAP transporter small permease [Metabacillus sediminilitoris]
MNEEKVDLRLEGLFCVLLLAIMTVLMFTEVVARYVFGSSFIWIEELTRYLFIWLTFVSAAYVTATKSHITVDVALSIFPKKVRPIIQKIGLLIWLAFSIVITYVGFEYSFTMLEVGGNSPTLGIAKGFIYLGIPLGYLCMTLRLIVQVFKEISTREAASTK